jgi:hypothetical protein
MTVDHTSHRSGYQPQLPLPASAGDHPGDSVPTVPAYGWRLDEHTRQVGRRGVAAARALLEGTPAAAAACTAQPRCEAAERAA